MEELEKHDKSWCYEMLKAKSKEFGPDTNPLETYLRITLNENNGELPGIPYVMEIWPIGHYSAVHNHGLNQVHQLQNLDTNKNACIMIQCYMYDGGI